MADMQPALAPTAHLLRPAQESNHDARLRQELIKHVREPSTPTAPSPYAIPEHHSPQAHHHHPHNIDPAIAGPGLSMSHGPGENGSEESNAAAAAAAAAAATAAMSPEPKKTSKRELSTSKRAAQNRAAQRAFRQRKEGHIKKLEEQVRDYQQLLDSFKTMQAENYQLRDYIISLQSRLLESQGSYPPAPANIHLPQPLVPHHPGAEHSQQPQQVISPVHAPTPALSLKQQSQSQSAAAQSSDRGAPAAPMSMGSSEADRQLQSQLQKSAAQVVADLDKGMHGSTDPALTRGIGAAPGSGAP